MPEGALLLLLVSLQRGLELVWSARNTRRLRRQGAREVAAGHYPLLVAVHAGWLAALWWAGWDQEVSRSWLLAYLALQALRLWVLASLGERWTTRIIVLDAPLVTRGPYRLMRHPNYLVVVLEIAVVPLALGLPWLAAGFSALNAVALAIRIRAEERALAAAPATTGPPR